MAVVQIAFFHRTATGGFHDTAGHRFGGFSKQLRHLVLPEALCWESAEDVILHWGDPACCADAPALAAASLAGRGVALSGRSWIHYHRPTHHLSLAVDRLGLYPILLCQQAQVTYLASDALAMAQLLGRHALPDGQALLELLAYGQLLSEQSSLRGVRHLHAATLCDINASGAYRVQHAAPYQLPTQASSESQAIEALVSAVDQRLCQDPDALLPVSGGLDSRLLLAAALAGGHHPRLLSYGRPGSVDLGIARQLAGVADSEIYTGLLTPQQFSSARQVTAQLGGGEVPLHHAHALVCSELVTRTRGTTLISSIGAEIFRAPYHHGVKDGEAHPGSLRQDLSYAAGRYARDNYGTTLQPFIEAFPKLHDYLEERLYLRLSVYQAKAASADHYLDAVYLGEQVRRFAVARQQVLARDYARSNPFMDDSVIGAFAGLPLAVRVGGQFYRRAIATLCPALAEIPWGENLRSWQEGLHWHEEYAVLAGWLDRRPPADANFDSEDGAWLKAVMDDFMPLQQALSDVGLSEAEIQNGVSHLLSSNSPAKRLHVLGTLAAYSGWSRHLNNQQTAQAA